MAFRRRRNQKRSRKSWYNRKYSALQLATKAWKATRYIKGLVNSEMLHNRIGGNINIDSTGGLLSLAAISQGDSDSGRTGNSIFARNLSMNLNVKINASNLATQFIRIVLLQDNQQISDTAPTISDVLDSAYPKTSQKIAPSFRLFLIPNSVRLF